MRSTPASARSRPVVGRPAFTLLELVVVLGILGLLLAIVLPAVQRSRASARNLLCRSNLHQIGIATHTYIEIHRQFPGDISNGPLFGLLPHVG